MSRTMKLSIIFVLSVFVLLNIFGKQYLDKKYQVSNPSTTTAIELPQEPKFSPVEPKSVSFVIAGDMMFDRYVNHSFKSIGFDHIFDNLDKSLLSGKDISLANLEGPVSAKPIVDDYPERSLVFNMPPETIGAIKNLGINGVSLANNHTLNAGADGFKTTQSLLSASGIKYAGYQNGFDDGSVLRYETAIPISFITVDYLAFNNTPKINEAIKKEKDAGQKVIVFPHWGEEYALTHNSSQRKTAESFISAGADLIIGSHPHVIQDVETIDNVPVFYSLGNFVFDQTFSKDTQEGLILTGSFNEETGLSIKICPFKSEKLKPKLMDANEKDLLLKRINGGSESIKIGP